MPSALMEFPYLIKPTNTGPFLTPYCWIEIKTTYNHIWRKYKFLLDTGADYTSVPKFLSEVIGYDLKKAKQEIMYTANNEPMVTYLGKINIKIDSLEITLPCAFTDKNDTPFLLGRAGLIERFEILLSAKKKVTIIT